MAGILDTHVETGGALGDGAADVAHTKNPQSFTADLHRQARGLLQPVPVTDKAVIEAKLAGGGQQQP
ncbi:hypothetical protein D3C75_982060 [compost metagenome]